MADDKPKSNIIRPGVSDELAARGINTVSATTQAQSRSEVMESVIIDDISPEAALMIADAMKDDRRDSTRRIRQRREEDLFSKILKAAIPLVFLGTGFLSSIRNMLSGDAIQGVWTMLSKLFVNIGDKLIANSARFGKLIFGEAGFFKNFLKTLFGETGPMMKIVGGNSVVFKGLLKGVGKTFLRRIPIIGSLISIASAITRIKKQEYLQGIIDLGAAAATMFPGVGTAIAIGLDLLNASIDVYEARGGQGGVSGAIVAFGQWFGERAKNIPILGHVWKFGEAIGDLLSGKPKTMGDFIMGIFGDAIPYGQAVVSLLFGDEMSFDGFASGGGVIGGAGEIVGKLVVAMKDSLTRLIKGALRSATGFLYGLGIPRGLVNKGLRILGMDDIIPMDDEDLNKQVAKMFKTSDMEERTNIRADLFKQGYAQEDINAAWKNMVANEKEKKLLSIPIERTTTDERLAKALEQNNHLLARQTEGLEGLLQTRGAGSDGIVATTQNNNYSQINNNQHSSTGVKNIRTQHFNLPAFQMP